MGDTGRVPSLTRLDSTLIFVRPPLALDVDRARIPGYGLGLATVQVTVPPGAAAPRRPRSPARR